MCVMSGDAFALTLHLLYEASRYQLRYLGTGDGFILFDEGRHLWPSSFSLLH